MSIALLFAAGGAFVTVSAGHPILEAAVTTISDAARAEIGRGGAVSCRASHKGLEMNVCLTAEEWRAVARNAQGIAARDRRRVEDWQGLTLLRTR